MCGISLVVNKKKEAVSQDLLTKMNETLVHRGPDGSSIYCHENVGLGHVRLSIVDLEKGKQPFFNEDRSIVSICNGEIYNFEALRIMLKAKGHIFTSRCDSEVLVHLYEEFPDDYINKLDGMFSFVILDTKKNKIELARDRTGIKPLFRYEDDNFLICSSEIKAILATKLCPKELDKQAIYDAFTFGYIPGERSSFRSIKHVIPANLISYDLSSNRCSTREYWAPVFGSNNILRALGRARYARTFRELFEDAVCTHTIGDVPLSSYLSGGIDSTATTLALNNVLGNSNPLKTYSIQFTNKEFDESEVFKKTAELYNLDANVLVMQEGSVELLKKINYHIEQPQFSPIDIPMFLLSKHVHEDQSKVAFVGEGADELLGGYFSFALNKIRSFFSLPGLSRNKDLLLRFLLPIVIPDAGFAEILRRIYSQDAKPVIERFGTYPAWLPYWLIRSDFKKSLFNSDCSDSLGEESTMHNVGQELKSKYPKIADFDKSIFFELKTRLPNYILLRSDRNSMAHNVEVRVPFLDNKLIDFTNQLPCGLKMHGLKEKYIANKSFSTFLPKHVLEKSKFGFNAPNDWIWDNEDPLCQELMSQDAIKASGMFEYQGLSDYLKQVREKNKLSPYQRVNTTEALTGVLTTQMLYYNFIA